MNLKLLLRNKYSSELRKGNTSEQEGKQPISGHFTSAFTDGLSSSTLFFNLDSIIHCYC